MADGRKCGLIGQKPVLDAVVRIGPTVTQKRPVTAHFLDARDVNFHDRQRFLLARFDNNDAEGIADERVAPEFDACSLAAELLEADTVDRRNPAAVGDGVAALNRLPRIELLRAVRRLLGGMPANGGRVEEDVRPLERGEPRAFRIPLVPADERANGTNPCIEGAKTEIAWREVELLV